MRQSLSCFGFLVLITIFIGCEDKKTFRVKTETVHVDSLHKIVLVKDTLVRPVLYTNVSGLSKLPVPEAKARFVSAVLPSILVAKYQVEENKRKVLLLKEKKRWDVADSAFYLDFKARYKADNIDDLSVRMITIPSSIVLAQAAVESGWGQSRFFLEGSNLFGIWSFNQFEPRIEAGKTRNKKKIYLRSYEDMSKSIVHYFEILGKARPYVSLRQTVYENGNNDPFKLLPHLKNFSERRTAYTNQLKKMIEVNNFTQYDHYRIDPQYIVEEE
ncbi:MAG TPA: glucosaminidase domain-containing protein [Ohtaekwangia sp.]